MSCSLSVSQTFAMLKTTDTLLLFCLFGATDALYKQWIPDTNYENETNWDKGAVPCGNDIAQFSAQRKLSVFVRNEHAAQEMRLPVDGEFILNAGSGFYASAGRDPGCGQGVTTRFKDSEGLRWFDPALWRTAETRHDLQLGNFLFSVHEESVPCRHDDVVFKDLSSFRVDVSSSHSSVPVKSVSVLGKMFDIGSEFGQYLSSRSGRLQFHGSSAVAVGNPGCGDPSGCECGNSINRAQICNGVTCSPLSCKSPLLPVGHCCQVCGAIVAVRYVDGFDLESYRRRIRQNFLEQTKYESVQLGMSKVSKPRKILGIVPYSTAPEIQVVILDGETAAQSEALARDIVKDAQSNGPTLRIAAAEFQSSSGSSSQQSGGNAGMVVGVVFGVLIVVTLVVVVGFLVRKGVVKMPAMPSIPSLASLKKKSDTGDPSVPVDHGFDNPMFDKPSLMPEIPGLYGTETKNSISLTRTGVHFINPVYDENETDFNA